MKKSEKERQRMRESSFNNMVKWYGINRRTGKTSRMIERANQYIKENPNHTVFVVGCTQTHAETISKNIFGAIPISMNDTNRIIGVSAKAFIDHYCYDYATRNDYEYYQEWIRFNELVADMERRLAAKKE